jgi:hypothetical protein
MIKKHFMTNPNRSLTQLAVKQLKEAKGYYNLFKTLQLIIINYYFYIL